jgi:hypothetical protein
MIIFCHAYDKKNNIGKYSYGVGYPICTINDDFISCKFVGDKEEPFYEVELPEKIERRMKR